MSATETKGSNGADAISRSSSITLVSPIVKDSVSEIAGKLAKIDPILGDIGDASKESLGHVPDMKELMKEISKLGDEVNKTKVDQVTRIEAMKADVRDKTKAEVLQSTGGKIHDLITAAIASQVEKDVARWGRGQKIQDMVERLKTTVGENNDLLTAATISFENSRSRRDNSTIDVQDDFNMDLKKIILSNGHPSELFPHNLRDLFSYDAERLIRLIKAHGIRPLDKHGENLNRFLAFIGVNAVVPEQLISFPEEQLPAYGNGTGLDEERGPRIGRRDSSTSQDEKQDSKSASWSAGWFS